MRPETGLAVATMISGFGASSIDVDAQMNAFLVAADGCRDDAIISACRRFTSGMVQGHNVARPPTSAQFGQECRSEHSAITAREMRSRALHKPPEPEFVHSEEHRMKMIGLFATLQRALAGDKSAQRALRSYGWKQDDGRQAAE